MIGQPFAPKYANYLQEATFAHGDIKFAMSYSNLLACHKSILFLSLREQESKCTVTLKCLQAITPDYVSSPSCLVKLNKYILIKFRLHRTTVQVKKT